MNPATRRPRRGDRHLRAAFVTLLFAAACSRAFAVDVTIGLAPDSGPPATFPMAMPPDTLLHLLAGFTAGMLAPALVSLAVPESTVRDHPYYLPAIGLTAAIDAGLAKETVDSTGFGDPDWWDAVHTALGGLLAGAIIFGIEGTLPPGSDERRELEVTGAAASIAAGVPVLIGLAAEIHAHFAGGSAP
jgi:hypothetical protein